MFGHRWTEAALINSFQYPDQIWPGKIGSHWLLMFKVLKTAFDSQKAGYWHILANASIFFLPGMGTNMINNI